MERRHHQQMGELFAMRVFGAMECGVLASMVHRASEASSSGLYGRKLTSDGSYAWVRGQSESLTRVPVPP